MATTDSNGLTNEETKEMEVVSDAFFRLVAMTDEEKKNLSSLDKAHGYFYIVCFSLYFEYFSGPTSPSHLDSYTLSKCCGSRIRASSTQF